MLRCVRRIFGNTPKTEKQKTRSTKIAATPQKEIKNNKRMLSYRKTPFLQCHSYSIPRKSLICMQKITACRRYNEPVVPAACVFDLNSWLRYLCCTCVNQRFHRRLIPITNRTTKNFAVSYYTQHRNRIKVKRHGDIGTLLHRDPYDFYILAPRKSL